MKNEKEKKILVKKHSALTAAIIYVSRQTIRKIKCFFKGHNWKYLEKSESYQSTYKCKRCGKEDKV